MRISLGFFVVAAVLIGCSNGETDAASANQPSTKTVSLSKDPNPNNPNGVSDYDMAKVETVQAGKRLATGIAIYASDFDDRLPLTDSGTKAWQESLKPYTKDIIDSKNPKGGTFVPNVELGGADLPSETNIDSVVAYEEFAWDDGSKAYVFCDATSKILPKVEPSQMKKKAAKPGSH